MRQLQHDRFTRSDVGDQSHVLHIRLCSHDDLISGCHPDWQSRLSWTHGGGRGRSEDSRHRRRLPKISERHLCVHAECHCCVFRFKAFSQRTISLFRNLHTFLHTHTHTLMPSSRRIVRDPNQYKTTPCRNGWNNPDNCPYGWRCQHAHSNDELRTRPARTYSPPAPPPSMVHSPVTIMTETLGPNHFELNQPVPDLPPLPSGPPPSLVTAIPNENETLEYLESVLAAMRDD